MSTFVCGIVSLILLNDECQCGTNLCGPSETFPQHETAVATFPMGS